MSVAVNVAAVFELDTDRSGRGAPGVLGVWRMHSSVPGGSPAFATARDTGGGSSVWRINLPRDRGRAEELLAGAEAALAASDDALRSAATRLERLVETPPSGVSFAAEPTASPEADLLALLHELRLGPAAVGFGLSFAPGARWKQTFEDFQAAIDEAQRALAYFCRVDTRVETRLLGRTAVTWAGDAVEVARAGATRAEFTLHRRGVALAIASRQALVRLVALAARGAGLAAIALASPGAALLALPAVWRFINQVRDEMQAYRAARGSAGAG